MNEKSAVLCVATMVLLAMGGLCAFPPADLPAHTGVSANARAPQTARVAQRVCGTPDLLERDVDFIERFVESERRRRGIKAGEILPANMSLGTIQVAFHVVYVQQFNSTFGLLTQSQVNSQIAALNAAFDNVDFQLASTSFTSNIDWFLHFPGSREERDMKLALGADSSRFLNIYSTGLSQIGLLGYATFPWNQSRNPGFDGVVIDFDSLPGGSFPYGEGDTAVHEVGHWLGLYHTFQGGCRRRNDVVADTPAEANPFFGCTLMPPDTCPSPGLDPIYNYMDYSDDACLDEFTPGQVSRMNQMLNTFRPGLF